MKVEVLTGIERRRRWSYDEKVRLLEETLVPGATVAEVARRHGVAQSVLFSWRRLAQQGRLVVPAAEAVFVPVSVTAADRDVPAAARDEPPPRRSGIIEIDFGGGRVVRVDSDVDAGALRRVLGVLGRR